MAEKDDEKTTTTGSAAAAGSTTGKTTTTPSRARAEDGTHALEVDAEDPGIDPRLDNRTGDQRPKLETFPAKPQQVDGPELGEEQEATARREAREDRGPRKGAKSPGPHGLGDTADKV